MEVAVRITPRDLAGVGVVVARERVIIVGIPVRGRPDVWLHICPIATIIAFDTDLRERKPHTQEQYHANHASYPSAAVRHEAPSLRETEKYMTFSGVTSELFDPRQCEQQEDIVSKN